APRRRRGPGPAAAPRRRHPAARALAASPAPAASAFVVAARPVARREFPAREGSGEPASMPVACVRPTASVQLGEPATVAPSGAAAVLAQLVQAGYGRSAVGRLVSLAPVVGCLG